MSVIVGLALLGGAVILWLRQRPQGDARMDPSENLANVTAFYVAVDSLGPAVQSHDPAFIDGLLRRFDRSAQGEHSLLSAIQSDLPRFNAEMVAALQADPSWAVGRAIMRPLIQVVPLRVNSPLGRALATAVGAKGPPVTMAAGEAIYQADDFYFWWEEHRAEYAAMPLYDEWRAHDIIRAHIIPLFAQRRSQASVPPN